MLAKLQTLPMLRDVTSDQQTGGTTLTLVIDRDKAARFGIQPQVIDDTLYDAFGQRQITQYFSQVNSYHLILEVMPDQLAAVDTLNKLYVKSSTGQAVPLSTFVKWTTAPVQPLSSSSAGTRSASKPHQTRCRAPQSWFPSTEVWHRRRPLHRTR